MPFSSEPCLQAFIRLVRAAEALHADVSRELAVVGLSSSQFCAMKVLHIHGKLAQKEIAKHVLKSGGNITVMVDSLEAQGLVSRERDTTDRRVVYVQLTEKGEEKYDELLPAHLERIRAAMAPLSGPECDSLIALLQKVSPEQIELACSQIA